jgi:hypothetical protein
MIWGRPTNLWLGLTTAISGAVSATLILALGFDPVIVGALAGVWQGVLGAGILLAANQPPTLNPGDTFKTRTPDGEPNYVTMVATPPAASKPVEIAPAPNPEEPHP